MTWIRDVDRLSRSTPSELADALLLRRQLVRSARALVPHLVAGDDGAGPCDAAGCALHATPDGAAVCRLARRVALLELADAAEEPAAGGAPAGAEPARRAFLHALVEVSDAVRYCRLTAHPAGSCWFGSQDGCADVLRLAHRVGAHTGR